MNPVVGCLKTAMMVLDVISRNRDCSAPLACSQVKQKVNQAFEVLRRYVLRPSDDATQEEGADNMSGKKKHLETLAGEFICMGDNNRNH